MAAQNRTTSILPPSQSLPSRVLAVWEVRRRRVEGRGTGARGAPRSHVPADRNPDLRRPTGPSHACRSLACARLNGGHSPRLPSRSHTRQPLACATEYSKPSPRRARPRHAVHAQWTKSERRTPPASSRRHVRPCCRLNHCAILAEKLNRSVPGSKSGPPFSYPTAPAARCRLTPPYDTSRWLPSTPLRRSARPEP